MPDERFFTEFPNPQQAARLLGQLAETSYVANKIYERPLYLYGNGNLGRMAWDYLEYIGWKPLGVIERYAETKVIKQIIDEKALVAVCVVTDSYYPIRDYLSERGISSVIPFYDLTEKYKDKHPLGNGWFFGHFNRGEFADTDTVLSNWSDDKSRAHHLAFIAWHKLRQEWNFIHDDIKNDDRYFIPEVMAALNDEETFVDGGAHLGETTKDFIRRKEGKYLAVHAIEPDPVNLDGISDYPGAIHPCAISNVEGIGLFHSGLGYASQLAFTGKDHVSLRKIDGLHLQPTFLKLHLEGHELPALKGAIFTLTKHRPIIAVTVYHNRDGVWRTPMWLMENLSDYRFLFRSHCWCGTGAVVYAIPNERPQ